jgi:hypothetical protein
MSGRTSLALGTVKHDGVLYRAIVTAPKGQKLGLLDQETALKATKIVQLHLQLHAGRRTEVAQPQGLSSNGLSWADKEVTSHAFDIKTNALHQEVAPDTTTGTELWNLFVRTIPTASNLPPVSPISSTLPQSPIYQQPSEEEDTIPLSEPHSPLITNSTENSNPSEGIQLNFAPLSPTEQEIKRLQYQLEVREKIHRNIPKWFDFRKEPLDEEEKKIEARLHQVHTGRPDQFEQHLANHIKWVKKIIDTLQAKANKVNTTINNNQTNNEI